MVIDIIRYLVSLASYKLLRIIRLVCWWCFCFACDDVYDVIDFLETIFLDLSTVAFGNESFAASVLI